jgi:ubiquitin carboxyl-terminal hydrolase L5
MTPLCLTSLQTNCFAYNSHCILRSLEMCQSSPEVDTTVQSTQTNNKPTMSSETPANASNGRSSGSKQEQINSPKVSASPAPLSNATFEPDSPSSKKRTLSEPSTEEEPSNKKAKEISPASPNSSEMPEIPASTISKETWQGFCEIESEPAYFSTILREIGVKDVTVREVFGMTPDLLDMLPQPIHGLILLFRYREFGNEDQATDCPPDVWFANQLPAQNSCGTLAMINTVMNSPDIEVGEHLVQFKDFTKDMTPFQRGEAFASFDFVKKIHNSFAKKMDILENDKHLSYKVKRAERLKDAPVKPINKTTTSRSRRRASADSVATDDSTESFEENGHHFIAFVPVGTEVWKLDGLDAQPTSVGSFNLDAGETWLTAASDIVGTLMAAGDDDYGVIALAQSPLSPLRRKASLTINTLAHVDSRLDAQTPTWRSFVEDSDEPTSPRLLGLEEHLPLYAVPASTKATIDAEASDQLLLRRAALVRELGGLAALIVEEMALEAGEEEKAAQRRFDSGPAIKVWLEMLAENGWLEENLKRFM